MNYPLPNLYVLWPGHGRMRSDTLQQNMLWNLNDCASFIGSGRVHMLGYGYWERSSHVLSVSFPPFHHCFTLHSEWRCSLQLLSDMRHPLYHAECSQIMPLTPARLEEVRAWWLLTLGWYVILKDLLWYLEFVDMVAPSVKLNLNYIC